VSRNNAHKWREIHCVRSKLSYASREARKSSLLREQFDWFRDYCGYAVSKGRVLRDVIGACSLTLDGWPCAGVHGFETGATKRIRLFLRSIHELLLTTLWLLCALFCECQCVHYIASSGKDLWTKRETIPAGIFMDGLRKTTKYFSQYSRCTGSRCVNPLSVKFNPLKTESESELLYDWRFTASQFVLAPSPLKLTTRVLFFSNWTLAVIVLSDEKMGLSRNVNALHFEAVQTRGTFNLFLYDHVLWN
jgi:hypothetical protein